MMHTERHSPSASHALRSRLRVLTCVPLLLLAIGCGGAEGEKKRSSTPSASASPAVVDATLAVQGTLRLDDFPSGWTPVVGPQDLDSGCKEVEAARQLSRARHSSPRFNQGQATLAQNVVYVFPDEATARKAFDMIAGADTRACFVQAMTEAFASRPEVELGETTTSRLSIDPVGDQHDAAHVTLPIAAEGVEADLNMDLVFVRANRAVSMGLFLDVPSAFDGRLRDDLTAATVQRLSDAMR